MWRRKVSLRKATVAILTSGFVNSGVMSSKTLTYALQDADDDVRAVAAEALLPVAGQLTALPAASISALRDQLWDILLDVEELSPSTGAACPPSRLVI
jgi:hypothetical protein